MSNIVFITSRFPYPITKGDQLRVYFQLKSLSTNNKVHLIALNEKDILVEQIEALSFCESIHVFKIPKLSRILSSAKCFFNSNPFQVGYFYNSSIKNKTHKLITEINPDYIHSHLIRTAEYVKDIQNIEKSIDFMDAFSIGMKKRGDIEKNPIKRAFLKSEYMRLKKYETKMFDYYTRSAIISQQDADFITNPSSEKIEIVPNGVDFDSFFPKKMEKVYDICFMGNMSYPPNVEAVRYTMEKIYPILRKKRPEIMFLVAGANPAPYIRSLHSEKIHVIETFNHISDSIAISKVMISPMVVSIGLQNKIIQAMAMKVPNVVSKAANNAIKAKNNEEILEAGEPVEYVTAIIRLLDDKNIYDRISKQAYEFVHKKYDWNIVNKSLELCIKGKIK